MTLANLAGFVAAEPAFDTRWRLVVEFLKEYHREPAEVRQALLADAPESTGDNRWDVLFAGLAEHLAMRGGRVHRRGRLAETCGASGSRSTHPVHARRRSCTRQPPSADVASSWLTTRSTP
jgi:hypothetical protein